MQLGTNLFVEIGGAKLTAFPRSNHAQDFNLRAKKKKGIIMSNSEIQSPLAIVNEKNRARSVHYSKLFSIAKMTKEVLVVRGASKKKVVRASGATASIIETAGFKQSYVTHKS